MTVNPAEIRARIESLKADEARAEGELATVQADIDKTREKLQGVLGCKPGKERDALTTLQAEAQAAEAEVLKLLQEAEAARNGQGIEVES